MANEEHAKILATGVQVWNQWRRNNPEISPDLSHIRTYDASASRLFGADPTGALGLVMYDSSSESNPTIVAPSNLVGANFSHANLSGANFYGARVSRANFYCADLSGANFSEAILDSANLCGAILSGARFDRANLCGAQLYRTNLKGILLSDANLSEADLREADLSNANLDSAVLIAANFEGANLRETQLISADLSSANITGADLTDAFLPIVRALGTRFDGAIMTGACIQDWNINSSTSLQDVVCKYVFKRCEYENGEWLRQERLPHDLTRPFAPGDFAKLVQQSFDTVALIFREGLDWRSFAYSFQQLQVQYADEQIAIQTIENKGDGTVVVKLAVAPDADKGNIEQSFWRGFEMAQKTIAGQYESRLEDKDKHINQLFALLQQSQERLGEVPKLMVENPRYDLRGSKFGGGFAADGGTQTGGTFNDFSQNIDQNINEIGGLIQALRNQAEAFPEGVRQETLDHIADLETDIGQPPEKRKPSRIKATLLALAGMATVISGMVAGANEFATNLQELSEKLGIPLPIEQVQPQAQQVDAIDVKAIKTDQP